jgi:hypothetical protein
VSRVDRKYREKVWDSDYHWRVARRLYDARQALGMSQPTFGRALGQRLHTTPYGQACVSGWEIATRAVPAAVLLAAEDMAAEVAAA